jgi:hypothetical protein
VSRTVAGESPLLRCSSGLSKSAHASASWLSETVPPKSTPRWQTQRQSSRECQQRAWLPLPQCRTFKCKGSPHGLSVALNLPGVAPASVWVLANEAQSKVEGSVPQAAKHSAVRSRCATARGRGSVSLLCVSGRSLLRLPCASSLALCASPVPPPSLFSSVPAPCWLCGSNRGTGRSGGQEKEKGCVLTMMAFVC